MAQGRVCGYALQRETRPEMAAKYNSMKESVRVGMQKLVLEKQNPEVPEDYGKMNAFFARIEGAA